MKNGLRTLTVAGLFIAVAYSSLAVAQNEAHETTLTLGSGYMDFASKRHIDNSGIPFAALGYNFTDQLGLEALAGTFTTRSDRPQDDNRQVQGTLFAVDGVYHFAPIFCQFQPYVLAGPGAMALNPNGYDAHVQGNINAAVGGQYFFSKKIALRVEFRDFYTFVGGKNDLYLNGGVSFLF